MIELLLVALALGLVNFAAAVGIGVAGVDSRTRWQVGVVFGLFETGMPIAGLAIGRSLSGTLGSASRWIGAGLLIATGIHALWQTRQSSEDHHDGPESRQTLGKLLVTGLALSIDNLAVGFSLGAYRVGLAAAAAIIGGVSVALTLAGLELGGRIGPVTGRRGELLGGLVLIGAGIAVATGAL
ncbi:manganese efflux pump MntP family protein [Streptomyces sp. NPDC056190]|uniref:manganese efflux pump MntP n=1 Tax=unclassified Streptomyces TaxID=2593676 RepID=UPI0035D9A480